MLIVRPIDWVRQLWREWSFLECQVTIVVVAMHTSDFVVPRNSWGVDWGMNGYIQIEMGQDLCSIGDYATIVSVNSTL